jgi:hypothetical protein
MHGTISALTEGEVIAAFVSLILFGFVVGYLTRAYLARRRRR